MPARHDGAKTTGLVLPTRIEGLHYVANSCEPVNGGTQPAEHAGFRGVIVDGDALLQPASDTAAHSVPRSLDLLLEAARQLGAARDTLRCLLDDPVTMGLPSARLAAASALTVAGDTLAGIRRTSRGPAGMPADSLSPHLSDILRESGELRRQEHHRQPEQPD